MYIWCCGVFVDITNAQSSRSRLTILVMSYAFTQPTLAHGTGARNEPVAHTQASVVPSWPEQDRTALRSEAGAFTPTSNSSIDAALEGNYQASRQCQVPSRKLAQTHSWSLICKTLGSWLLALLVQSLCLGTLGLLFSSLHPLTHSHWSR